MTNYVQQFPAALSSDSERFG